MIAPEKLAQAFVPLYSYHMPEWWQTKSGVLALLAAGVGIAAGLIFLVWYYFFYTPPLTLELWRARELRALAGMLDDDRVDYKVFFGAATFFLKQYTLRLYGWKVLNKTDDELVAFFATKKQIPQALIPRIEKLLSYAQMVKFADQQALSENADEALGCLDTVVEQLQPYIPVKK